MTDGTPADGTKTDGSLAAQVLALSTRAERVLSSHARTRELVAALPRTDVSPLRIAFLGPYSAGKSTLVAALLRLPSSDVDELVDAAPKTHEPTPYPWNGVTLVDLPGTLSGDDAHADAARLGMRGADVLVIVTSSELPGEAETNAILDALDSDGFADRSVVVVNKMNAENSDRGVILHEVGKRLGPFADRVPIVATDARDHLDAINDPDLTDDQRALLLSESGVDTLADQLLRTVAPGVTGLRPRAQAFELLRVLADAEQRWMLEGEDLRAAETAAKVAASISQAKEGVLSTLDLAGDSFESAVKAAGARTARSVSEDKDIVPADVTEGLVEALVRERTDLEAAFASSIKTAFEALASEYGTGVPEPEAWVHDLDVPETAETVTDESQKDVSPLERAIRKGAEAGVKAGARRVQEWIEDIAAGGTGQGSPASGIATWINDSAAGRTVLNLGKKVSDEAGKFKPWGRGKAAAKVSGAAGTVQWAAAFIGPLLDLRGVVQDVGERQQLDKYRKTIARRFDEEAHRERCALHDAGARHLDAWLSEVEKSLSGLTRRGTEIGAERERALEAIRGLHGEAKGLVGSPA